MKKIVKGNDFTLRIPVMKMVEGEAQAFPLPACTDVVVQVCNQFKRIPLAFEIDVKEDNVLLARVEGDQMSIGTYAIEVKGKIFGNDWRSNEYPQFAIVANNADADTEFGETDDGDNSVEMDTALVILPPTVELSELIDKANQAVKTSEATNTTLNENEEARKEAETGRVAAEQEREKAERERFLDELGREKAEGSRTEAESDRVIEEMTRVGAENTRQDNELVRKNNEGKRVAAEQERVKAEEARVGAENSRSNAETERVDAETQRVSAEGERVKAERSRSSAEDERVKAEKKRQTDTDTAIQNLNTHRTEFDNAEAARVKAENARVEAEKTRQQAETDRASAEDERAKTESARVDAETKRKSDFDAAIKAAETATVGAEKVDAELNGNVLMVTNRNGEVKSLDFEQWDLEEKVNITISTSVEGVSVKGIVVNVFLNGATTSTKYTSDADGKVSFTIPRGTIYKISFQELKNCDPLPSLTYTAALRVRDINVDYKALSGETASVVVIIDKAENGAVKPFQGVSVTCEVANGDTTTTETNEKGKVTFSIPWGKSYKITAGKPDGYYAFRGIYEKNNIADVAEHNLYYHFFPTTSGVFILDTAGAQYTLDEWQESGKTAEDAALVKITTQNLAEHNGCMGFSPSALQAGYPSKRWCTQNIQFSNIPLNGNNTKDALYYDGYKTSKLIREEAEERILSTPAFSYAYDCTVEIAEEVLHGYVASLGQMYEMNINKAIVDEVVMALYGANAKLFSPLFSQNKWTSTQYNATFAWNYSSSASNYFKSDSNVVLPVFAC